MKLFFMSFPCIGLMPILSSLNISPERDMPITYMLFPFKSDRLKIGLSPFRKTAHIGVYTIDGPNRNFFEFSLVNIMHVRSALPSMMSCLLFSHDSTLMV